MLNVHEQDYDALSNKAKKLLAGLVGKKHILTPAQRMAIPQQEMPAQPAVKRILNMDEVALGYTTEQAMVEAFRCLKCRNAPCIEGCPVHIDIPGFITAITEGNFKQAISIIRKSSILPAVCGRVCPQEEQCQLPCTVGKALKDTEQSVSIGRLERFVADWANQRRGDETPFVKPDTGKKVAVVGSGPAGITVAADVRREGHAVTLFEALHKPGGVMMYGIPEFRLPVSVVDVEIEMLKAMGVTVECNFLVGRTRKLSELMEKDGFDAVFIGTGAGLPKFMGIDGEHFVGVYSANEFLTRVNLMRAFERGRADTPILGMHSVAVLGGGNVAMDCARTAVRLGASEVHVLYRRTEKEMPARAEEIHHAKEEGVFIHELNNATRILGDEYGHVKRLECLRYELGEPDESGRRRPIEIPNSDFHMKVDGVIVAIGNDSNPLVKTTTPEITTNKWGNIVIDENGETSMPGVFAGGDIVLGAATVIQAMGQGRRAARSINAMLKRG